MWRGARCLQRCLAARLAIRLARAQEPPRQLTSLCSLRAFASPGARWAGSRAKATPTYGEVPTDGTAWEEVEFELPSHCAGCGVELQQDDPEAAGFFQVSKKLIEQLSAPPVEEEADHEDEGEEQEGTEPGGGDDTPAQPGRVKDKWWQFDQIVESWADGGGGGEGQASKRQHIEVRSFVDAEQEESMAGDVLCARCYSLRHYGRVKSAGAEAALPEFDFERRVGRRIALQKFRRSVVLVVVDLADFDGSLPRAAVRSLLPPEELARRDLPQRLPHGFRLVVAANKADLLPRQASAARVEAWARRRMAQGGLPRASAVHVVSSEKGTGVKQLLADLQAAVGSRGDVWVVGAQNAGKSSLINAMRRAAGLPAGRHVTAAALPGTTLGVVPVPSLLPRGCKMLDTPGVPHAFQLASLMSADEMRMLLPKRPLKPRTFRIGAGQTVSLGAVARLDVLQCPGATLYLTVWASDEVVLHMGKTEAAAERYAKHAGSKLVPPVGGEERMASFPALVPIDVEVVGESWKESSQDVAIAGLGWVAVGTSGAASLRVWAPPKVAVTTRNALAPDFARDLERPGFDAAAIKLGGAAAPAPSKAAAKQQGGKGRAPGGAARGAD